MLKRFESKFDKVEGCWVWKAYCNKNGYGQFQVPDGDGLFHTQYAHRVAWELYRGPVPEGLCVCHICDNPSCVNPDHLFVGTHKDNSQDMVKKGRHLEGIRKRPPRGPISEETRHKMSLAKRGERHWAAKPVEIDGVVYPTQAAAAEALGLTRQAIHYRVKKGV